MEFNPRPLRIGRHVSANQTLDPARLRHTSFVGWLVGSRKACRGFGFRLYQFDPIATRLTTGPGVHRRPRAAPPR